MTTIADSPAEMEKLVRRQPEVQANMKHIERLVEDIRMQTEENLTEREDLKKMMDSFSEKKSHYDQATAQC